jgi:hypothetical protein
MTELLNLDIYNAAQHDAGKNSTFLPSLYTMAMKTRL